MTFEDDDILVDSVGEGIEIALPGDTIRKRHVATRASTKREIIVLVEGDSEFIGYSIGLDENTLQILELKSGEVSSITWDSIVAISDGTPFTKLTPDQKADVDRRTSSFRKTSMNWLKTNWPNVYDRKESPRPSRPYQGQYPRYSPDTEGSITNAD